MVKLFCFPYAGASAQCYARWRRGLPAWLDVRPVELPGRGARFGEPLHEQLAPLVAQLVTELRADLHAPYALFGHSLGALIAFEVAHALPTAGCRNLSNCSSLVPARPVIGTMSVTRGWMPTLT